jgi:hypothetical protein
MKTTLDIDDDVLQAAMELAAREQKTADALISEWARRGIRAPLESTTERLLLNGFEVIPANGRVVTSELVRQIIEETHDRTVGCQPADRSFRRCSCQSRGRLGLAVCKPIVRLGDVPTDAKRLH